MKEIFIPDTSVIIEGILSKKIVNKELKPSSLILHEALISGLEYRTNQNMTLGHFGLKELERIKELSVGMKFQLIFSGIKLKAVEIRNMELDEIDSLIRDLCYEKDATLITANKTQARIAKTKGIRCNLIELDLLKKQLKFEKYFDNTTMSIHLKENVFPYAKKGVPGSWEFVKIGSKKLTQDSLQEIAREMIEEAGIRKDGFIEIERKGSTIIQLGLFRIVITRPPFSDGHEITAVRPVKKLDLPDYNLSPRLNERLMNQAEGVLIAGSPGMGKSTFAQALAVTYADQEKVVKTVEAPRDLVLPDNVTQYAISHSDAYEVHDILLLSRPDYTLFDEMRNTDDFRLFSDLRLSGVGMVGIVHATNPIDAIQRFVGRIELGVIPQVIDTVIFIKDGRIEKVLSLNMTVKVPSGMTEADLARPVVIVNDFETRKLEYELYSYGEETVVIPVKKGEKSPSQEIAQKAIINSLRKYSVVKKVDVVSDHKCIVYVEPKNIAKIIGKKGANISKIEKDLGIGIDVQEFSEDKKRNKDISYSTKITKKGISFFLGDDMISKSVDIFHDGDYVLTAAVSKKGVVKIQKKNKIGKLLIDAINLREDVKLCAGNNS